MRSADPRGARARSMPGFRRRVDAALADENARWEQSGPADGGKSWSATARPGATPADAPIVQRGVSVTSALGLPHVAGRGVDRREHPDEPRHSRDHDRRRRARQRDAHADGNVRHDRFVAGDSSRASCSRSRSPASRPEIDAGDRRTIRHESVIARQIRHRTNRMSLRGGQESPGQMTLVAACRFF